MLEWGAEYSLLEWPNISPTLHARPSWLGCELFSTFHIGDIRSFNMQSIRFPKSWNLHACVCDPMHWDDLITGLFTSSTHSVSRKSDKVLSCGFKCYKPNLATQKIKQVEIHSWKWFKICNHKTTIDLTRFY